MDAEAMDPTAKNKWQKSFSVLLNKMIVDGLRPNQDTEINKQLIEYMDMMDDDDVGTLTEDEDNSDDDSIVGDIEEDFHVHGCEDDTDYGIVTLTEDIHEDALANEVMHPIPEQEMDRIRNFMCRCTKRKKENQPTQTSCMQKLNPVEVYDRRHQISMLSADMRDMVIFGHYDTHVRTTELTSDNKRTPTKRKAPWTEYIVGDVKICRTAYMFLHCLTEKTLVAIHKQFREYGFVPRSVKKAKQKHCLQPEDIKRIITFLRSYAEKHAVVLPGRQANQKDFSGEVLPSHVTRAAIWREYKEMSNKLDPDCRVVSLSSFRYIWRTFLPHLRSTRPMSDLCWQCQKNNYLVYKSNGLPEEEKSATLKVQLEHLSLVNAERAVYNKMREDCGVICTDRKLHLIHNPVEPATMNDTMHYSFDFAQQIHYPFRHHQPGEMFFKTPRKCGIFGICCEGIPEQVNYLVDEGMASGKGSNAVLSYIHHFFWKYGLGEKEVDLHCDNCCGQNKNNFVLWYCAWRTIHKLHLRLGLHFLIVGHTKFGPDCYFGQFKKMLRKSDVHNLDDIAKLVDKSSKPNIPQLVGTENGHVMVECYDWQKFFQPYFRRLENIKQYQHFRFDASEPGFVFAKKQPNGEETMFQLLRDVKVLPPKDGFPILPPPGLDRDRQNYLYKQIREYCEEYAKDTTCPKPPPSPPPSSKKSKKPPRI